MLKPSCETPSFATSLMEADLAANPHDAPTAPTAPQPDVQALKAILNSCNVPDPLCQALLSTGVESITDFAFAYNTQADLDSFCRVDSLWAELDITEPQHSPAMARLRMALHRCKSIAMQEAPAPSALAQAPTAQSPQNVWAEHAPPRLSTEVVNQLVQTFKLNYPGEHLDRNTMPSIRLLSLVHKWFQPGGTITWVPWQLRLSTAQYEDIMHSKSSKMLRAEARHSSSVPRCSMKRLKRPWKTCASAPPGLPESKPCTATPLQSATGPISAG